MMTDYSIVDSRPAGKAVQFGAGSIGRGFIGQLFSQSGYEVVFSEVDPRLVEALNAARSYPLRVVSENGDLESEVRNVRAVSGLDAQAVAREIADAEVVGTAVGANILPRIAPALAAGLALRWESGNEAPLNVILCENLVDADRAFRSMVADRLEGADKDRLTRLVGFVRASVGRMVPVMTDDMREGNILRVWVEEYDHLPVDAEGFVGPIPSIYNMEPVAPFELYVQRKLYIHNMGHAAFSYLGQLRGHRYIWEAAGDPAVVRVAAAAMRESARAIAAEHGVDAAPLLAHVEELLGRFANRKLGDTIERVGRDLPRKLAPRDRIMGSLELCSRMGIAHEEIVEALAAALLFDDVASTSVRDQIAAGGPRAVLTGLCGMRPEDPDLARALDRYESLRSGRPRP
jgi:mannitol-1-phosphate 5-dehydrogenase